MTLRAADSVEGEQPRSARRTIRTTERATSVKRLWPGWQRCLAVVSSLLTVTLCGASVYLWQAPLPPLPDAGLAGRDMTSVSSIVRIGSEASLEICLRQIKTRELFKPSVPMPSEDRIAKSTAQELANRLQFVGTIGNADDLAALVFIPNRGPGTFRVGDRVAEFVLKDVKPDRLILGLADEEATLKR